MADEQRSEQELADLRAQAEEAKRIKAEHEAEKQARAKAEQELAASRKKYDDDMKQVAAYLQQQSQPAPKPEDDDPDAIISRKDLMRAQQESERRSAEAQAQHAQLLLRNQRNINKQLASQRLGPRAEKYMAEIDAHLDKLDPSVAAQPTAYDEVFKYVRAAHFDEELAEAQARRESDEGGEAESPDREPNSPTPSRPISRTESISPSSSVTATRPINRSQVQRPRLTEEQRRVAAGFGMADEDYAGKWADDTEMINNDYMGFRDKEGHVRKRV